jgi:hypothetical protein
MADTKDKRERKVNIEEKNYLIFKLQLFARAVRRYSIFAV